MMMACMYVGVRIVAEPIAGMGNVWRTIQRRLNVSRRAQIMEDWNTSGAAGIRIALIVE